MSDHDNSLDDPSGNPTKRFHWSFSFGTNPDEMRRAIDEARAAGIEPEVKTHVWEWKPSANVDNVEPAYHADPLATLRTIMAWIPGVLFITVLLGGIVLGFVDPTLGPIWGGIIGLIFGSCAYEMIKPSRRWWS